MAAIKVYLLHPCAGDKLVILSWAFEGPIDLRQLNASKFHITQKCSSGKITRLRDMLGDSRSEIEVYCCFEPLKWGLGLTGYRIGLRLLFDSVKFTHHWELIFLDYLL